MLSSLVTWSLLANPAWGGVWVREQGSVYAQVGVAHTMAGATFDEGGAVAGMADRRFLGPVVGPILEDGRYAGTELAAYGEVGLAPESWPVRIEAFGTLPARSAVMRWDVAGGALDDIRQANLGGGDASLGTRVGGPAGPLALAATASVSVPLYDNGPRALRQGDGNSDFYDDRVALGEGTVNVDVGGAIGAPLGSVGWAQVDSALRLRDRGYAMAVPSRAQVGLRPFEPLAVLLEADTLATLPGGDRPDRYLDAWDKSPLVIDHAHRVALGGGLMVAPSGLPGGALVRASHMVWGRRTPRSTTLSFAVFLER